MNQRYFIGVDASKAKLDICTVNQDKEVLLEKIILNKQSRIVAFLGALIKRLSKDGSEVLICCEHTGVYTRPLELACEQLGAALWVENAIKIKRASTELRGKTDQQDAKRIAIYACRYRDKARLYKPVSEKSQRMKTLLLAREDVLKSLHGFKAQLAESKSHDAYKYAILKEAFGGVIRELTKQITKLDKQLAQLANEDQKIKQNLTLLQTIPGVGRINALNMIVYTDNFRAFETAKHLACYAGVVPFPNQSGAVTKKDRISKHANQILKRLLHMAAMAAVRSNSDLKEYYIRKVKEGKNKMSVINAVRNKLVHRMFVVIKQQRAYQPFILSTQEILAH